MTPPERYSVSPLPSFCTIPRQPQPLPRQLVTIARWLIPRLRPRNSRLIVLERLLIDQLAEELAEEPAPLPHPAGTGTP
jgi:hypothetical protein